MLKLLLLGVVAASAAPVITLNLGEAVSPFKHNGLTTRPSTSPATTSRVHQCEANDASASKNCGMPTASVYDHHDALDERHIKREFSLLTNDAGTCSGTSCTCKDTERSQTCATFIDYTQRSFYAIEYYAKDFSGNAAEKVVFTVLLDDDRAPTLAFPSTFTQECRKISMTVPMPIVTDNVDGNSNDWSTQLRATLRVNGATAATKSLAVSSSTVYTYTAHDFAGAFGAMGTNNKVSNQKTFIVQDTLPPFIVDPSIPAVECSKETPTFEVPSTTCTDQCDPTKTIGASKATIDRDSVTSVPIVYTCTDIAGNTATPVSKTIRVVDRTPPEIDVSLSYVTTDSVGTWDGTVFTHHGGHSNKGFKPSGTDQAQNPKFSCGDTCCEHVAESHGWVESCSNYASATFNELKPGTYYHKFTCTDCNDLITNSCRTIINVDKYVPIIKILKNTVSDNLFEASHDSNYVDSGATCSDQVDGVLSKDIEVSGDVITLSNPDTYHVTYKCCDVAGNCATPAVRTVLVEDNACPSCKMLGKHVSREASFAYTDDGATCTDDLQGKIDTVATGKINVEVTGCQYVTYSATDSHGNTNTGGGKCTNKQSDVIRTVCVRDTLKPVIALHYGTRKIHQGKALDKGINGQDNPAHKYDGGSLMAESSSVNGWVIAAVASAVAGVALLAVGSKKVSTSVPV